MVNGLRVEHTDAITWYLIIPGSKVHGDNMGPIWGRQDPGGPHVGPMNLHLWDVTQDNSIKILTNISVFVTMQYA